MCIATATIPSSSKEVSASSLGSGAACRSLWDAASSLPSPSGRPEAGSQRQRCHDWQSSADPAESLVRWTTGHCALRKPPEVPFLPAHSSNQREYSTLPGHAAPSGAGATQGSSRHPDLPTRTLPSSRAYRLCLRF